MNPFHNLLNISVKSRKRKQVNCPISPELGILTYTPNESKFNSRLYSYQLQSSHENRKNNSFCNIKHKLHNSNVATGGEIGGYGKLSPSDISDEYSAKYLVEAMSEYESYHLQFR